MFHCGLFLITTWLDFSYFFPFQQRSDSISQGMSTWQPPPGPSSCTTTMDDRNGLVVISITKSFPSHRSHLTKLTQGKNWNIYHNFLRANFEYFRHSTVRDDKNDKNCPHTFFSIFALDVVRFYLASTKISLKSQTNKDIRQYCSISSIFVPFFQL